ncbi:MAG: winged helix-turn-helix transcriptional regulator, partial [Thermoplasmata archaeon]|nr:winged helix-turn-helix transcriptional regulator [Thermoplasmata archaeon]
YYWYVIPSIETDNGKIVGEFQDNISSFTVDISYTPPPEPDFNISLNRSYIEIEPGKSTVVGIIIRNNGNVPLTIALSYQAEPSDILFIDLLTRRISIAPGETITITLGVTVSPQAEPNEIVTITIQGKADKIGLTDRRIISIRVLPDGEVTKPDDGRGGISGWQNILILLIVTILILISLFLYSTLKRHRLLKHQRREMIYGYVKENPGEHFRGIQKALGLEVGVLAHHINKLEREEFVKSRQDGQYRRFYPMDAKIDVKLILSKIQENILNWIKKNPGISGSTLATQIGVDRKLVTYHVNVLQNAGFIYTEKEGRDKICFSAIG